MEILDVVDEHGNPTGETIERNEAHRKGIRHRTSHVWVARRRGEEAEILLQKRSADKDSHPGCLDCSSAGHIPAGVDFVPSALRELQEELGIEATADELIYCGQTVGCRHNKFYGEEFIDSQVSNIYLIERDLEPEAFHIQTEELESVQWFRYFDALHMVKTNAQPNCIKLEELLMLEEKLK